MAKKKAPTDPIPEAVAALSRAAVDRIPRKLFGTAKSPGIFQGSGQKQKLAAAKCLENGWLEGTGDFVGTGKSKQETFRVTESGVEFAMENAEIPSLLKDLLMANDSQRETLQQVATQLRILSEAVPAQHDLLLYLKQSARISPALPNGSMNPPPPTLAIGQEWLHQIVTYVTQYRKQHPHRSCTFAELYRDVAAPAGATIGQFHDGLRQLAQQRKIWLEPWTGAMSDLDQDHLALVQGKEMKFYADPV